MRDERGTVKALLDDMEPAGVVVTADALHATRPFADYPHERGASYICAVKTNNVHLYNQLDVLPWHTN